MVSPRCTHWAVSAVGLLLLVLSSSRVGLGAETVTNKIGMKLVLVPAGDFMMGSPESDSDARKNEKPQHSVRITHPFYLGAYEVTVGQFRRFVTENGYRTDAEKDPEGGWGYDPVAGSYGQKQQYNWNNTGFQTDEHPVVNVSWNDAVAFCKWLSGKEGKAYRLPTEAEWEYACRAGTQTRYYVGDDREKLVEVGNVPDASYGGKFLRSTSGWEKICIRGNDGYVLTAPVGRFLPNAWGLYDMHGNVLEWCADWHDEDWYRPSSVEDPMGPSSGEWRVIRGGSWEGYPEGAGSAVRFARRPARVGGHVGFRVARTP